MKIGAVLLLLGLAAALPAAQIPKAEELLQVQAAPTASPDARSAKIHLEVRVASGWHINSHQPSEDYLIATTATLEKAAGLTASEPVYPPGQLKKFAFSEKPLSVYEGVFPIDIPVSWSGSPPAAFVGVVQFQACNDAQCLPPASARFETTLAAPGASSSSTLVGGAVALSQAPQSGGDASPARGASNDFADLLARRGLAVALLVVFGWGLALNLTPCVYPVIPLTVSFFGGQAPGNTRRVVGLAALYVLGMATMYSALGVAAAISGKLFGAALQSPWVLTSIAVVLVLLALSMFGFYDIRMPTGLMQKAGARSGALGAYGMGLLVGVVAAPCIGPVVLALLAFVAARGQAAFGFLIFFVLSLGLGLPYLFLGVFSGSLSRLPRAGMWMEGVKKVFGWLLLGMAAYFLRSVLPQPFGAWLLPAVLWIGAAAFAVGFASLRPAIRVPVAALLAGAGIFLMPHTGSPSQALAWRSYSNEETQLAGSPAIIDFSADWCLPCRELDEKTFSDPRVRAAMSRRRLFKADLTKAGSPESVALAEKYRILGVPTLVFLDSTGKERADLRLVGFEPADRFLDRLERAP